MTDTLTVEIHWRGTNDVTADDLKAGKEWASRNGYDVHTWRDINHAGDHVTLTRVIAPGGPTVALYETQPRKQDR